MCSKLSEGCQLKSFSCLYYELSTYSACLSVASVSNFEHTSYLFLPIGKNLYKVNKNAIWATPLGSVPLPYWIVHRLLLPRLWAEP